MVASKGHGDCTLDVFPSGSVIKLVWNVHCNSAYKKAIRLFLAATIKMFGVIVPDDLFASYHVTQCYNIDKMHLGYCGSSRVHKGKMKKVAE